ncbi:hypothetical protein O181_034229 [Austropuccinia psidii MF-1]|uniref:Uncharacterized protein n=1 Tax=Austropuccinia psidii MF-1 TaxID=1389203 RepID=A0A9Q3H9B3_9BASI|nr:hypothetical protein [Austropuccinia psidii MF-1]
MEAKEAHDTEALGKTGICHSCVSPNHYGENCPKDREEIFPREEETRKTPEGSKSDSNSVGNGCGDDSYNEPNQNDQYLVLLEDHEIKGSGPFHSRRRKIITKNLDGLRHKPLKSECMSTRKLFTQGHIDHIRTSSSQRIIKSHH